VYDGEFYWRIGYSYCVPLCVAFSGVGNAAGASTDTVTGVSLYVTLGLHSDQEQTRINYQQSNPHM